MFRFVFLPTLFSGLCRVRFGHSAYAPFPPFTPQNIVYPKQKPSFSHYIPQATFRSFIPALALPAKKLHFTAKNHASPAASRRRPQPPLRYGYLCPPPSLHSQTARASPLRSKKITSLPLRQFFTASFRLKAVLPALFYATPTHSPRPPTPKKTVEFFILFALPRRF
jgi:hypothetical protein